MPIPDYETMMRPVLQAFADGAQNVAETLPDLCHQFQITDEEAEELIPSGRVTLLSNRAHWARTYLSKAGMLSSPKRNVHEITDLGRATLKAHPDRIDNSVLKASDAFTEWKDASRSGAATGNEPESRADYVDVEPAQTPEDQIHSLFKQVDSVLAADVLDAVLSLSPARFEQLIVDLLLAMGYGGGQASLGARIGRSGDGGIDGVIKEDPLGLDAVYIQAKRYAPENKVGRPALQAFVGSMTGESATKGVFVTTSDFSREVQGYIERVQQRIVLINGDTLAHLMVAHGVGVRVAKTYVLKSLDGEYFGED